MLSIKPHTISISIIVNKIKHSVCIELVEYSYHLHAENILKAAQVTIYSASGKVVSFRRHPVDKMERLWFEWVGAGIQSMLSH